MKLKDKIYGQEQVGIVAYGDSWTYGSCADGWVEAKCAGADSEKIHGSWVLQVRRCLQEINPKISAHNSGRGGWPSRGGVDGYDQMVAPFDGDLFILNFGINDWRHGISLDCFRANISHIGERNIAAGAECLIWTSTLYPQDLDRIMAGMLPLTIADFRTLFVVTMRFFERFPSLMRPYSLTSNRRSCAPGRAIPALTAGLKIPFI